MLDNKTIKKLEIVRVIDKDTGELKRVDIDKTVEPEQKAIEQYCREWDNRSKEKKLLFQNLKGVKIA